MRYWFTITAMHTIWTNIIRHLDDGVGSQTLPNIHVQILISLIMNLDYYTTLPNKIKTAIWKIPIFYLVTQTTTNINLKENIPLSDGVADQLTSLIFSLKQGNSVARDLPRTDSETNNTIFVIYILDIDSHCPYLLSGQTTFQLTSC